MFFVAGSLEIQRLKKLQAKFGKIKACVAEPNKELIGNYKDGWQEMTMVWKTLNYTSGTTNPSRTYGELTENITSSPLSIPYTFWLIWLEETIRRLYSLLEQGGMILLIVTGGEIIKQKVNEIKLM